MGTCRRHPNVAKAHLQKRLVMDAVFQIECQFALKIGRHLKGLGDLGAMVSFQGQGHIHPVCIDPVNEVVDGVNGAFHFRLKFQVSLPGIVVDDAAVFGLKQTQVKFQNMTNVLSNAGIGKDVERRREQVVIHVEKNPFQGTQIGNAGIVEHDVES